MQQRIANKIEYKGSQESDPYEINKYKFTIGSNNYHKDQNTTRGSPASLPLESPECLLPEFWGVSRSPACGVFLGQD
jgi:hypothetical protein